MTCPTCDHTTHRIDADNGGPGLFWCPRCGTLAKHYNILALVDEVSVPHLVERCRRFESFHFAHMSPVWFELGLQEAIRRPEDRRKP